MATRTRVDPYARRLAVHDDDPAARGRCDRHDADNQVGGVALGLLECDGVDRLEKVLEEAAARAGCSGCTDSQAASAAKAIHAHTKRCWLHAVNGLPLSSGE